MSYRFDQFVLDPQNVRLTADGENRALEPKSLRLLQFLIENRQRVVPKDEILAAVWEGVAVSDNALTRAIAQVRKALNDDPKEPRYIETIPTVGYRFLAVVEEGAATETAPARERGYSKWLAWSGVALALIGAGFGAVRFLRPAASQENTNMAVPFTTYPGRELYPDFSPDGNQVAFSWSGDTDDNFDIYVKSVGSETPLRLTTAAEQDMRPRWSPDGRVIAFERLLPGGRTAVMLIPPLGGPERKLTEFVSRWNETGAPSISLDTSWSPDGKWLAVPGDIEATGADRIYLVSLETGEARALTKPDASGWGDYSPTFSPDSSALLFVRAPIFAPGILYRLSLDRDFAPRGEPQRLAAVAFRPVTLSWARGGREIIFASVGGTRSAYRMSATGVEPPVPIQSLGTSVSSLAVSKDGRRLAYSVGTRSANVWRLELTAKGAAPERFIASTRRDVFPQYSPDGRKIVFYSDRSGTDQIWVCDADGSRPVAITAMRPGITGSPRWSPDGQTISFDSNVTGNYQIYIVGADGGKVRKMTSGAMSHYASNWSRDGRWIYFASGATGDVWRIPSNGGDPVRVTQHGGMAAQESPDGKLLYYNKAIGKGSLWKMPVGGGQETMIADSLYRYNYAVTDTGVYLMSGPEVDFLNPDTGARRTILKTREQDLGLAVSPDGRYLLFSQVDAIGSDLMLVENFR